MSVDTPQQLYEELALRCERQREARQRDIYLILAADAAMTAGRTSEAEVLRRRLLSLSPHSLLRPYPSFADALSSTDIEEYVADLRRQFPPEQMAQLVHESNTPKNGESLRGPELAPPLPAASVRPRPVPVAPRREPVPSPYAQYDVPLPPGPGFETWGSRLALLLFLFVFVIALGLATYVLVRPIML